MFAGLRADSAPDGGPVSELASLAGQSSGVLSVEVCDVSPDPSPRLNPYAVARTLPLVQSASCAPGAGNTGAQTQVDGADVVHEVELPSVPVSCVPDWLEGRFPIGLSVDAVLDLFSRSDGELLDWSTEEHKRSGGVLMRRGHVSVLDVVGKGAYLTISGQGMRELEGDRVVKDWQALALNLWALNFDATRFDLAFDDKEGILPFEEIEARANEAGKDWGSRSFTTRFRMAGGQWSGGLDRPYGYTVNFGVRGSETYVRFYDKAAQMKAAGLEVGDCEQWTRAECEWRRERANAALLAFGGYRMPTVAEVAEGNTSIVKLDVSPTSYFAGVLRACIDFKDVEAVTRLGASATRLENRPSAPWWDRFLAGVEKARLEVKPVLRSVERTVEWLTSQVAPALGVLLKASGYGVESLLGLAGMGLGKLRKAHLEMLERHENNFARGLAAVNPLAQFDGDDQVNPVFGAVREYWAAQENRPSWPVGPVFHDAEGVLCYG